MNPHKNLATIALLIFSAAILFSNVLMHQELKTLRRSIPSDNSHLYHSLDGSIRNLEREIQSLKEGSEWISSMKFSPGTGSSTPAAVQVDVEWAFRELEQNAQVTLYYRAPSDPSWMEWIPLEPQSQGGLNYRATLRLDSVKEYEVQIHASGATHRASAPISVPQDLYQPPALDIFGSETVFRNEESKVDLLIHIGTFAPPNFAFNNIRSITGTFQLDGVPWDVEIRNLQEYFKDFNTEDLEALRKEHPQVAEDYDFYMSQFHGEVINNGVLFNMRMNGIPMEKYNELIADYNQRHDHAVNLTVTYEGGTQILYKAYPFFDVLERVTAH